MPRSLDELRAALDRVDTALLDALAEREALVNEVATFKISAGRTLRDRGREASLLAARVERGRERGLEAYYVTRIFREVIDHSVRVQEDAFADHRNPERAQARAWVVGYQGVEGAYSSLAAARHFSSSLREVHYRGYESFEALLEAVRDQGIDFAVLPIENTTAGSINEAYDLLARMDLSIVGEEVQHVDHCLIGMPGVRPSEIRHVSSHPQALLQCTRYLNGLTEAAVEAYTDTAMAVERVASLGDPTRAAVASAEAAERYGLEVIERHIANQRENYTRFVIVARRPATFDLALACKSSLVFAAHHERGALLAALQILNEHHLNLTKLESRPRPGSPWEYLFYVDFEGNSADPVVAGALQALRGATSYLKFLGSYPARQHERSHEAPLPEGYEPGTRPIDPATPRPARQVRARGIVFGGPDPVVIASVPHLEDGAPAHRAARALYERGARVLLVAEPTAESARRWASAAAQTNMMVAHRCDDIEHIEAAIGVADVVLIPGEATEDTALLHRAGRSDVVVLLERPAVASVEAWLAKAQVVVDAGNARVVLVDAGVQAVAGGERRVLDLAGIAEAIAVSGYPVIVDPATYVRFAAGSLEAIAAAGAAGLLVRGQRDQVLRPR